MKKILIASLLVLAGCGMFSPDPPPPPSGLQFSPTGGQAPLTQSASSLTSLVGNWVWLSLLLLLFVPAVREPIGQFWTAVFRAFSVPFLWLRSYWESHSAARKHDREG